MAGFGLGRPDAVLQKCGRWEIVVFCDVVNFSDARHGVGHVVVPLRLRLESGVIRVLWLARDTRIEFCWA